MYRATAATKGIMKYTFKIHIKHMSLTSRNVYNTNKLTVKHITHVGYWNCVNMGEIFQVNVVVGAIVVQRGKSITFWCGSSQSGMFLSLFHFIIPIKGIFQHFSLPFSGNSAWIWILMDIVRHSNYYFFLSFHESAAGLLGFVKSMLQNKPSDLCVSGLCCQRLLITDACVALIRTRTYWSLVFLLGGSFTSAHRLRIRTYFA